MLEFPNTPSYSEAQLPGQESPQGRHKQGHGLMRIPEACGSEKDKGMESAEDGIKSEKKF